ncbi:MAG: iron-sulfur cluster carrier protein ApbC [Pseudomonadota bacterium]|nr:iron-sulfur cluster carrier protein ApbC [Pseudomonadota bacterium]
MSDIKTLAIEKLNELNPEYPELIEDIVVANKKIYLSLKTDKAKVDKFTKIKLQIEKELAAIDGIDSVSVSLTSHSDAIQAKAIPQENASGVSEVRNLISVASGKGGVGKSTTSINLAIAINQLGFSVGLLDADVYGPSIPKLVGDRQKPKKSKAGKILPIKKYNISLMSIGFLVPEDSPMIWRGPMVISAVNQMLNDVEWGKLDYLVVDMPPGTGDVQLTMAQRVPMSGAVIVSTPQDLALIDARKGIEMFKKVNIPILGIIENMSTFICPNCKNESHIFGFEGAKLEANNQKVDFLGDIPLEIDLRECSDNGKPIILSKTDSVVSKKFLEIAKSVTKKVGDESSSSKPNIIIN